MPAHPHLNNQNKKFFPRGERVQVLHGERVDKTGKLLEVKEDSFYVIIDTIGEQVTGCWYPRPEYTWEEI